MTSQKVELMDLWKKSMRITEKEIKAFIDVKREDFIPENLKNRAYDDLPLPLLRGKTISQPTTVMMMTHALELEDGNIVFEIGTGSGYQTAIIAKIIGPSGKVISTEIVPELVSFAKQNLEKAAIKNVEIFEEDGSKGIEGKGPFDRIIITAASREFPPRLLEQLKPDGIVVGPVGSYNEQEMVKAVKGKDGKLQLDFLGQFLFSPLYGKYGFEV
jgi:protein-L-isoaspartate(D-aspartate) O-methyltransferase